MCRLTLDHAVGVILRTGFGVEGVLITRELAAVETKLISVPDETLIVSFDNFREPLKNKNCYLRHGLRPFTIPVHNIDIIHLESIGDNIDSRTQIQRSGIG